MAGGELLLRASELDIARGRSTILRGVDLELRAGTVVHLHGENGAGKTSLLRVLAGLRRPARGALAATASRAWVPERLALPPVSIATWANAVGLTAERVLHTAGLPPEAGATRLTALSKGQGQRVAIASAIEAGHRILLLDEAFSGVDAEHRRTIGDLLSSAAGRGCGVVISGHGAAQRDVAATTVWAVHEGTVRQHAVDAPGRAPVRIVVQRGGERLTWTVDATAVDDAVRTALDRGDHLIEVVPE